MPTYSYPGIYVEEKSGDARSIVPVGTSTAAFLGVAPAAGKHLNEPIAVSNWSQFIREFVDCFDNNPLDLFLFNIQIDSV